MNTFTFVYRNVPACFLKKSMQLQAETEETATVNPARDAANAHDEIRRSLRRIYESGIRTFTIYTMEPFLWSYGTENVHDLISAAREIGFRRVNICTDGMLPFDCGADTVFIHTKDFGRHDELLKNSPSHQKLLRNIENSKHRNIIVSFMITEDNRNDFRRASENVRNNPKLRGIFFSFCNPLLPLREIYPSSSARYAIARELLLLKIENAPVLNTYSCLKKISADGNPCCSNCDCFRYHVSDLLKMRPDAVFAAIDSIAR